MEFEDKYSEFQKFPGKQRASRLMLFLVRHHLARDEQDAKKKAFTAAIIIIIISAVLMVWSYAKSNTKQKLYNFPDALISRFPPELQIKIRNVIYAARK